MTKQIPRILLADVTVLRIVLGVGALLFAFGWWFADSSGGAYNAMLRHAPSWVWGVGFFVYGSIELVVAVRGCTKLLAYALVLLGSYLWLFTLLSFADNPSRPMGSADVMFCALFLMEIWVGSHNVAGASDAV
jgi:hypothetical protein